MIVKLLTEHHLEFLSLKGGCRGPSESTLVKIKIVGNHMPRLKLSVAIGTSFAIIMFAVVMITKILETSL